MTEQEQDQRQAVLQEAVTWRGTPFCHMGCVKGKEGGVDCAMFIVEVFSRVGMVQNLVVEPYSYQWHQNQHEERYLNIIRQYAREVDSPLPGDIIVFRMEKEQPYSHGGIVEAWPVIIHAVDKLGCYRENISRSLFAKKERLFFRPFIWGD